jgi:hypothetical protein
MPARYLALSLLAATLTVGVARGDATPKPLNGAELQAALADRAIAWDTHRPDFHETYCASGDWLVTGTRAPMRGRYAIEGDAVCVSVEGVEARQCYRFYLSDKQYFRRWTESASPDYEPVALQPTACEAQSAVSR